MERGGRFHRYRRHAKHSPSSATSSGTNSEQGNNSPTNLPNTLISNGGVAPATEAANFPVHVAAPDRAPPAPCVVREQDQYMPIANVIRIMRRILPPHAKISDDAKETIQECVSEYISFITGEANDRCQKEQRKTITAEDVLWAMGKLGFDDYVEPLTLFLNRYRDNESDRSSSHHHHHHHRDAFLKRSGAGFVDYGMNHGMPPPQPQFAASYPMPPPAAGAGQSMFDGGMMMSGYYKDPTDTDGGANANPSQLLHYDPFAQFK